MNKNLFAAALFGILLFAFQTPARVFYPPTYTEKFVIKALQTLHSAEVVYNVTSGNGNYGSLNNLLQENLIDTALASSNKYGYHFVVQTTTSSATTQAAFIITATPQYYGKMGRASFYIATSGVIHGADKHGAIAGVDDPILENLCSPNEECTLSNIRWLHSAEVTYQVTSGNGNFGTLNQLAAAGLVGELLARGYANGYNFTVAFTVQTNNNPPTFSISAVPITYGTTGVRSFYIATDGVIHAADKHGEPATADDPVLEY